MIIVFFIQKRKTTVKYNILFFNIELGTLYYVKIITESFQIIIY